MIVFVEWKHFVYFEQRKNSSLIVRSSELVLFPFAVPLGYDPALAVLLGRAEEHVLVLVVQLRLAHLLHGRHPELVVEQKFDALLFVRDLAESVG